MRRLRINEDKANELVKDILVRHYGYEEDLEISRYIGDDGRPYYTASDVMRYQGEPYKRLIPLQFRGYINHLKIALQEMGYDFDWVELIVLDDKVQYEIEYRKILSSKKRGDNGYGLRKRRKNS